ncbi:adenosine kinase [Scaptodrosophila lebanonensis]|uniref:Adenosine kinase n=1 Tax=Drosophila lebanonensis TaxID=7225 RepID=A0A6J2TGH2_DROLE|nr:adenosine kinase [Scaptodrosophila lebanonensis]
MRQLPKGSVGYFVSRHLRQGAAIAFKPNWSLYSTQSLLAPPSPITLSHRVHSTRNFASKEKKKKMEVEEGVLIGFGNPLLDITVSIDDSSLLEKYGLQANAAIIAEEKHLPLFEELSGMDTVQYSAGGACQNSMRIVQWILGSPFRALYFGAVGKDKFGETIAKRAKADGVETHYQVNDGKPTGTCAVIISGMNRSLVANLGAAAHFTEDWMDTEESLCVVERAQYYYITGFFLAVSPPTVLRIAKFANGSNRTTVINLSAVFVMQTHKKELDELIPYVDIIIGNKEEALAFSSASNWDTSDIFEIGRRLQCLPKEKGLPRVVMITDAVCPVLVFQENDKLLEYPVPKVDKSKIVDTNGCGDAFVGGFLSQLVQHMPLDYCIRAGIFASQQVLGIVGIQINKLPKFNESCM